MKLLEGKSAIVTGSGRGIGRAVATLFAAHGAHVVVNDLDGDVAEGVVNAINVGEQRVRSRLWLDAGTAQIRRAERELRLIPPNTPDPVTVWKQTFDYAQSDLGILVPKRFVYDYFLDFRRNNDGKVESFRTDRLISEFGTFQRFTVSSSEEEKKTIIKDKPQSNDKKPEI